MAKAKGEVAGMDEEDISEMEDGFRMLGAPLFEEEGEAKTTKAFKKMEENRAKKPWEQVATFTSCHSHHFRFKNLVRRKYWMIRVRDDCMVPSQAGFQQDTLIRVARKRAGLQQLLFHREAREQPSNNSVLKISWMLRTWPKRQWGAAN
jgi:hypothetical protein